MLKIVLSGDDAFLVENITHALIADATLNLLHGEEVLTCEIDTLKLSSRAHGMLDGHCRIEVLRTWDFAHENHRYIGTVKEKIIRDNIMLIKAKAEFK